MKNKVIINVIGSHKAFAMNDIITNITESPYCHEDLFYISLDPNVNAQYVSVLESKLKRSELRYENVLKGLIYYRDRFKK